MLEGEKVILKPLTDFNEKLFRCRSDPLVTRTLASPYKTRSRERFAERIKMNGDTRKFFEIIDKNTRETVGAIQIHNINYRAGRAKIGYRICREYRDRGYATEAIRLIVKYSFDTLNLHLLYAEVKEPNAISARALMKNGFKLVGRIPDYTIVPGYGRVALLIFALSRSRLRI